MNLFIFIHVPKQNSPPSSYNYLLGRRKLPIPPEQLPWRYFSVALFTNYPNAFDTIDCSILIQKMNLLNFATAFLYWFFNYLTHRQHFKLIDSICSSLLTAKHGVPQGSILGPILFNLCVADMSSITPNSNCIQHVDDSTLYWSCKTNQKDACMKELEKDLTPIAKLSIKTNLVFNNGKTKCMLISSNQLLTRHKLKDEPLQIAAITPN